MARMPKVKKVKLDGVGRAELSIRDPASKLGLRKHGVNRMASMKRAGKPRGK